MTRIGFISATLVMAAAGCERGAATKKPSAGPDTPVDATVRVALRIAGTDSGAFRSVLVPIRAITVTTSDGRRLAVQRTRSVVDLATSDTSSVVGYVEVPADVGALRTTVVLDDWGGYETASEAGAIDLRGPPIAFDVARELMVARAKAVVTIDVTRSLVARSTGSLMLMPQSGVRF